MNIGMIRVIITLVGLCSGLMASQGWGAVILVDTAMDVEATDGDCSLREAIDNANDDAATHIDCLAGDSGEDSIQFDAALAGSTMVLDGSQLPLVRDTLTIAGPVTDNPTGVVVSAENLSQIFAASSGPAGSPGSFTLTLKDMTLEKGSSAIQGGAIAIDNANLSLQSVEIRLSGTQGVSSGGGGGAIFARQGTVTLHTSSLRDNFVLGNNSRGGGVNVENGELVLMDSLVQGNNTSGDGSDGGGIYVYAGELTLLNSHVLDNTTTGQNADGGGIRAYGNLEIINSVVSDNRVEGPSSSGGGAKIWDYPSEISIFGSTFSGNSATAAGGAIWTDTKGRLTIDSSTFSDNVAVTNAGGVFAYKASELAITNTTFSGNQASGGSIPLIGGVYAPISASTTITHSTFFNNSGSVPNYAIRAGSNLTLHNSLVVQTGTAPGCFGAAVSSTGSLATSASCGATVASMAAINLAPLIDGTHALGVGSVALDAADDSLCLDVDQRGVLRPDGIGGTPGIDGSCDIGAFEALADIIFDDRFN